MENRGGRGGSRGGRGGPGGRGPGGGQGGGNNGPRRGAPVMMGPSERQSMQDRGYSYDSLRAGRDDGGGRGRPQGPQGFRGPDPQRPRRDGPSRYEGLPADVEENIPGAAPSGAPAIDPFELFLAYHLGITADDKYKATNIHDVARRFGVSAGRIKQLLQDYHMDPDTVINSDFDLAMAQVDIQVAPEGVSRKELARGIYEDYLKAKKGTRDWARQLADDARENAKTFGRR